MLIIYFKKSLNILFLVFISSLYFSSVYSSCDIGPPGFNGNPSGFRPFLAQSLFACDPLITSDPVNCSNPGGEPHRVYVDADLEASGDLHAELVVVLPGSGQDPANTDAILKSSAYAGYRTIGLAFEGLSLNAACGSSFGAAYSTCTDDFRSEVVYGGVFINPVNSIEQRLLDLLQYLDNAFPAGGWDDYYTGAVYGYPAQLNYDNIVIAGYSLGSGHAAYWAKDHTFYGVVTAAGPSDHYSFFMFHFDPVLMTFTFTQHHRLADWILGSHATGSNRYAMYHVGEGSDKGDLLSKAWDSFGIPTNPSGVPLDVTEAWDGVSPILAWPYTGSEQRFSINTSYIEPDCNAHLATGADACVADDFDIVANLPSIVPVYMHMFCSAGNDL